MSKSVTIIIIDGDKDDRYITKHSFTDIGWDEHVLILESAEKSMSHLYALHTPADYPTMILTAFRLPVMNGLELCRQLKSSDKFHSIPVAFYASQLTMGFKDELDALPVIGYFEKPSSMEESVKIAESIKQKALSLASG